MRERRGRRRWRAYRIKPKKSQPNSENPSRGGSELAVATQPPDNRRPPHQPAPHDSHPPPPLAPPNQPRRLPKEGLQADALRRRVAGGVAPGKRRSEAAAAREDGPEPTASFLVAAAPRRSRARSGAVVGHRQWRERRVRGRADRSAPPPRARGGLVLDLD